MILRSKTLGEIEVSAEASVYMPDGILGFEDRKKYVLVDVPGCGPFRWLVCEEDPDLCFAVVDPKLAYGEGYKAPLAESDLDLLDIAEGDVTETYVLVTPSDGPEKITANLKGPVVLNTRNRVAKQVVVYNPSYAFRHPIQLEDAAETSSDRSRLRAQVYR